MRRFLLISSLLLTGCHKDWTRTIVLGVVEPDRLDASGANTTQQIDDLQAAQAALAAQTKQNTPLTLVQQDACDPTDADGDPYDDDCPGNPTSSTPPTQ